MTDLGKAIASMTQEQIAELEGKIEFVFAELPGSPVVSVDDVEIITEDVPGWVTASDGYVTVGLDVTVTPELKREGMARELVNRIQNLRKTTGFEISDRVEVVLEDLPEVKESVESFRDYIAGQVLATSLTCGEVPSDAVEFDIDGLIVKASVKKA